MFLSIWDWKCNNGVGHPVITSNLHFTLSAHFEAKIKIFIASLALFGLTGIHALSSVRFYAMGTEFF